MKTAIEIPDPLFRAAKAAAAARGESLRDLVSNALRRHLAAPPEGGQQAEGWRRVFGKAQASDVARVDAVIAADLERVDPADWR